MAETEEWLGFAMWVVVSSPLEVTEWVTESEVLVGSEMLGLWLSVAMEPEETVLAGLACGPLLGHR